MIKTTGKFLVLEGGGAVGKSTQVKLLVDYLTNKGIEVVKTREPGGSPSAELIRDLLVNGETDRFDGITELLLHTAARRDHVEKCIKPAMLDGKWVVCDRFFDSSIAYQGFGHGIHLRTIKEATTLAIGSFVPDMTIILDMPVLDGLDRAIKRGRESGTRYERMDTEFHVRVRDGFRSIALEGGRYHIVNANHTIAKVHTDIVRLIETKLR